MDKRWNKLADILVNYSTQVKPGERVMIAMHEVESLPLARATYESVVKAGGFPQIQFLSETLRHSLLQYGSDEQLFLGAGNRSLRHGMGGCIYWITWSSQPV